MIPIKDLDVKAFGNRIAEYREKLNISRKMLAKRCGYSESHIANLENGRSSRLNLETVYDISKTLGVTLNDLLVDSLDFYKPSDDIEKIMETVLLFNDEQLEIYSELLDDYFNSINKKDS